LTEENNFLLSASSFFLAYNAGIGKDGNFLDLYFFAFSLASY